MIQGKCVTLKVAKAEERKLIYRMGLSTDCLTEGVGGEYVNGLADFEAEYTERYFDSREPAVCGGMMIYVGNDPVGFIVYDQTSYEDDWVNPGIMTIDIWLDGEKNCGKGYGTDATKALAKYLHKQHAIHTFYAYIDKTNRRSIRACEKAGFVQVDDHDRPSVLERIFTPKAMRSPLFEDEYLSGDTVLMLKE